MAVDRKLGLAVTTRTFDWRQMCIAMWGDEWGKNDIAYEMGQGIKKESTDRYRTGIYSPNLGYTGFIYYQVNGNTGNYPDMIGNRIALKQGGELAHQ